MGDRPFPGLAGFNFPGAHTGEGGLAWYILVPPVRLFLDPQHLTQQGGDLKLHHVVRHLWKQEGHGVWNGLVDHHHGQCQLAKQTGLYAARGKSKGHKQLTE